MHSKIQRASYSIPEIAERHNVSVATVYRWIAAGQLESVKLNGLRRVLAEQETRFLQDMATQSGHSVREEAA